MELRPEQLEGLGGVDSQSTSATNGYIRFKSGIQIAWRTDTDTVSSGAFGQVYFADQTMGAWGATFDAVLAITTSTDLRQHWTAHSSATTTTAGAIRIYRPTAFTSISVTSTVIAIGTWS